MRRLIRAIYENGVFKPAEKVELPDHGTVEIEIVSQDDLPLSGLAKAAEKGGAFEFLESSDEDIYSLADGEEV